MILVEKAQYNSCNFCCKKKQKLQCSGLTSKYSNSFVIVFIVWRQCLLVCVTEQHYVSIFFTRLWSVRKLCFSSTRVAWWLFNKNVIFLPSRFIFPCRLVLCSYACTVENPEIPGFCVYQKAEVCAQTINEWRISKRSVVLLRRQIFASTKFIWVSEPFYYELSNINYVIILII